MSNLAIRARADNEVTLTGEAPGFTLGPASFWLCRRACSCLNAENGTPNAEGN
jgi:hypothetical protein